MKGKRNPPHPPGRGVYFGELKRKLQVRKRAGIGRQKVGYGA